jgi:hypothetical protein
MWGRPAFYRGTIVPPMESKHTFFSKFLYSIEPRPEGGFIARCKDPNAPSIEGATREEVDQKIQASIGAGLAAQFPGLKLPLDSKEVKLSYHVEAKPGGGYIVHHGDPAHEPIEGSTREKVESAIESKLLSLLMAKLPPELSQQLTSQLSSGSVDVVVNRKVSVGFTRAGLPTPAPDEKTTLPQSMALDASPITPERNSSGAILRFLLALLIVAAMMYFFLHRH